MAQCSKCRYRFRTLDDEEGMHDCPSCGYDGFAFHCVVCNEGISKRNQAFSRRDDYDNMTCPSCYASELESQENL